MAVAPAAFLSSRSGACRDHGGMSVRLRESTTDLFGDVPVTEDDVRLWLLAVPRIDPDSPRAAVYARCWNVAAKIRAAKLAGWFHTLDPRPPPTHRGRLRWQL